MTACLLWSTDVVLLSCVHTGKGSAAMVHPLSVRQLPINPKQRFERLFAFKPQWEATELEPYLQGMQVGELGHVQSGSSNCSNCFTFPPLTPSVPARDPRLLSPLLMPALLWEMSACTANVFLPAVPWKISAFTTNSKRIPVQGQAHRAVRCA